MNDKNVDNHGLTERILKSIQKYKELYFTKEFVIPFLNSIGYQKVDDHGGPYEEGKDVICYKQNEIGKIEFTVIQVKKYKPSAKSSGNLAFSEVVNQLQQSAEKKIPHLDGNEYYPSTIYFITPFSIDTRSLQSRFEGYQALKRNKVTIIDGPEFINLLNIYNYDLIKKILGEDIIINRIIEKSLKNNELLNALNYNLEFNISNFYSDLDFGVGNVSTRFFFSRKFYPKIVKIKCNQEEWSIIKSINSLVIETFETSILNRSIIDIETDYENRLKHFKSILDEIRELSEIKRKLKENINTIEDEIEIKILEIETLYDKYNEKINKRAKNDYSNFIEYLEFFTKNGKINTEIHLTRSEIELKERELLKKYEKAIKNIDLEILGIKDHKILIEKRKYLQLKIIELSNKIEKLEISIQLAEYSFEINGTFLSKKLEEIQFWLHEKINKFNSDTNSTKEITPFLIDCTKIFNSFDKIFRNEYINNSIGIIENRQLKNLPRLSIPIQKIFDTKINLLILGEAGSGKTTTLHVYTKSKLENSNDSELYLFLPLARLFSEYEISQLESTNQDPFSIFIDLTINYFNKNGLNILKIDFINTVLKRATTIILDGIDEIIYKFPKILYIINEIPKQFPRTQVIISARSSGDYIDKINFTSLTLLPFTDTQRNNFIYGWFKNKKIDKSRDLINHIESNKELSNVIRVPLLTTILCILAENNVPLPNSETRLYEERLRLLLGQYDIHKQVVRLKSDRHLLEIVSRKIAFIFHKKNIREENKYEIINLIIKNLKEKFTVEQLTSAVNELIDPCNILVPMTDDGKFGFGHLRYQEYLAATELCNNRGINIFHFLHSIWWRGTLIIFSKLTDDIEFIIDNVLREIPVSKVYETLTGMVNVRPEKERKLLMNLIEKHKKLDTFDPAENSFFSDFSSF